MTTANTAAAITAPYADGQTWTRNDADGETVQLLDEIDASDADIVAYSEPDADWKVATFADGSMVLLTESWWAVLVADGMDGNGDRRWTELNPAAVVTNDDIAALSTEAAAAGDEAQVALCTAALIGDTDARRECARVIADAAAQAAE
jgi:hypothetical protein